MTCVHGFFGNCQIALSETTNNHVVKPKKTLRKKTYRHKKKPNDKEIANKQPNVRKRVDSKRTELSKLPKHAKFILDFSSIYHFKNN